MECGATCLRMIAKFHGKEYSAAIRIPAFGAVFLRGEGTFPKPKAAKTSKTPQAIKRLRKPPRPWAKRPQPPPRP